MGLFGKEVAQRMYHSYVDLHALHSMEVYFSGFKHFNFPTVFPKVSVSGLLTHSPTMTPFDAPGKQVF